MVEAEAAVGDARFGGALFGARRVVREVRGDVAVAARNGTTVGVFLQVVEDIRSFKLAGGAE